jgi:hypothetical protein
MRLFDKENVIAYYQNRELLNNEIGIPQFPEREYFEEINRVKVVRVSFPH